MTTIISVRCKDGIVMTSDTQTSTDITKGDTAKVTKVGKRGLLGCAGPENYIQLLEDLVQERITDETKDYLKALVICHKEYSRQVYDDASLAGVVRRDGTLPDRYLTDGLFAIHDRQNNPHIFRIPAPYRPFEQKKQPYRLSVGIGNLFADFDFKTIEERVLKRVGLGWENISVRLVSQFTAFMLASIGRYSLQTGEKADVWVIRNDGSEPENVGNEYLWGSKADYGTHPFKVLLKTALTEHPNEAKKWIMNYFDNDLLLGLVYKFTEGLPVSGSQSQSNPTKTAGN